MLISEILTFITIFINMKKKIIITEKQMVVIVNLINENNVHDKIVGNIVDDLNLNYEPAMGVHEIGNEFYNTAMITKKVTGDTITPKDLYEYLKHKHNAPSEFIQQVILDWYHGRLNGGNRKLSKNVGFS